MNLPKRRLLFERLLAQNPNPTTELEYGSAFELLISVILSAQATDKRVNIVTAKLFQAAHTPQAILDLGEEKLKEYIQSIGLFNSKAKNIMATCQMLVEQFQSKVPETRELLETLPGVGRKTANVVLNTVFHQPTMPVDTHVFRVANRTGLARGKTVESVEKALLKQVPPEFLQKAHHALILHGRYTCLARKPNCPHCVIRDICEYPHKTQL